MITLLIDNDSGSGEYQLRKYNFYGRSLSIQALQLQPQKNDHLFLFLLPIKDWPLAQKNASVMAQIRVGKYHNTFPSFSARCF